MKLLFDENLSRHLVSELREAFPDSVHVTGVGLASSSDDAVWDYAKRNDLVIVSKDSDFHQRSFLYGAPPKVIWLAVGNATTEQIAAVLRSHLTDIQTFANSAEAAFLLLGKK